MLMFESLAKEMPWTDLNQGQVAMQVRAQMKLITVAAP
jgi:hypothetical protein